MFKSLFFILFFYSAVTPSQLAPLVNRTGFPQTFREANECFFGNYHSLLEALENNIISNLHRIRIIERAHASEAENSTSNKSLRMTKHSNVLTGTNAGLIRQVDSLKGKCRYFPKWN
ncbi:MAG: hypothetical protein A2622_13250 [Bdellovibrionales bacterium RIFCSPHIGHO2_01_FULL_40_29]|nr:MAG: hypothetical protein A2622_13250 [Bdellovibrionales bacterium RIFCSPHIGHO2_01_FULL_40_29]OFZ33345.1 MAG: hypothetical protein A3D17_13635 [Bdellovibrionales bacterium RIFCSPHIGHO2_02_FULL_40_15]